MYSYLTHVMTLANSIIGVSVLAMPFCFKQCGIVLAILILVFCSLLSRLACHFLIKSAVMSRRRNFEFLAFHAFGPMGKFLVELFIIGFLLGTCIAFFVVTGDLGPQIFAKILNKNPEDIRTSFLLVTGLIIVLPLGLLKNIDSLSSICTVSIGFYLCLIIKVISEAIGHIFDDDWMENVNYWRPAGILQCLPIFSMALFCQTQLFEIYESIPNVSLEKMNIVVKGAINICTIVYLCVGFFGYVAFCTQSFSGNILTSFEPSLTSDCIKIGFVLSVLFSFPLVIFPCRASLNSLLFRRSYGHEGSTNYIPEIRFRCLTLMIVLVSLITGLLMPNIEFVLGLVGSTIGVIICLIFPAGFFIAISTKNTNERLIAQVILFIGIWIMILGSYANLYAIDDSSTTKISLVTEKPFVPINNIHLNIIEDNNKNNNNNNAVEIPQVIDILPKEKEESLIKNDKNLNDFPVEKLQEKIKIDVEKIKIKANVTSSTDNKNPQVENNKITGMNKVAKVLTAEEKLKQVLAAEENVKKDSETDNLINVDAIKKEESEIAEADGKDPLLQEQQRVKEVIERNKIESIELLQEQKAILKNFANKKEEIKKEKKLLESFKANSPVEKILEKDSNGFNDKVDGSSDRHIKVDNKSKEINNNLGNLNNTGININNQSKEIKIKNTNVPLDPKINVPSNESRGPVLNILTNWTANQLNNSLGKINTDDNRSINDTKSANELPVPLLLKLNKSVDSDTGRANDEKNIGRDILQDRGREKRDVDDLEVRKIIFDQEVEKKRESLIIDGNDSKECKLEKSKPVIGDKVGLEGSSLGVSSTESIIKTNINLSEQKFTEDLNFGLDPPANSEYQVFKKRDLKALKPGRRKD
ncbi:putative sodium-coupled neutral amino acid transporter 10 [Microplitis mediator]|uniref:putative sodium-coupled neutral amino acid transporter 10 n=1 Tax=Microplitis mediator TaxID=375433 RepID=UPI0025537BA4|nr:putative sodium-coupled neutral amino acid transporter 10 [Microplitis mediator]